MGRACSTKGGRGGKGGGEEKCVLGGKNQKKGDHWEDQDVGELIILG
jgi:hypothetical protein